MLFCMGVKLGFSLQVKNKEWVYWTDFLPFDIVHRIILNLAVLPSTGKGNHIKKAVLSRWAPKFSELIKKCNRDQILSVASDRKIAIKNKKKITRRFRNKTLTSRVLHWKLGGRQSAKKLDCFNKSGLQCQQRWGVREGATKENIWAKSKEIIRWWRKLYNEQFHLL